MRNYITISLIILSTLCQAQINLVEHFGNLCAAGECILIYNQKIHIAGTTCIGIGNNQLTTAGFVARYDLFGNLESYIQVGDTIRDYEAEKILIDNQNNQYIIGDFQRDSQGLSTNAGVFIQKRDSNSQIIWSIENQDTSTDVSYFLLDAILIENKLFLTGGYIPGENIVPGVPDQDILFMVFDTSGSLMSKKPIGDNFSQEKGHEIIKYDDNKLIIASVKNLPGANSKNWVLMLDYQGNILDEYISTSDRRIGVWDIVKTQDGGLACASGASNGNFSNYMVKSYVEKLDSNLNQVWDYTIDDFFSGWNLATAIDEDDNGDLIIGGNYGAYVGPNDTIGYDVFLQRLSPLGDSVWHKGYYFYNKVTYNETHNLYDLTVHNNTIYFIGDANDFNAAPPPGQSMWLVSTDSNGIISSVEDKLIESGNHVKIYPNPASDKLFINNAEKIFAIRILDLQGSTTKAMYDFNESYVDISSLAPGLYILEAQIKDHLVRQKFVKE